MDKAEMLMDDIEQFRKTNELRAPGDDLVRIHRSFPQAGGGASDARRISSAACMKNDPEIAPSQIYAYAALKSGVPSPTARPT